MEFLLIIVIPFIIFSITSGWYGKNTLSLKHRPVSIAILFGLLFGLLFGGSAGVFFGGSAGFYSVLFSDEVKSKDESLGLSMCFFTGPFTGIFAGAFTGYLVEEGYGITHAFTLIWLGFCIAVILLEYLTVFLRRKYQEN